MKLLVTGAAAGYALAARPLRAEPSGPDTASGQSSVSRTDLTSHLTKALS